MDEKGRRRFHGAFTGGFSAGYFNTAGSAEGWQPQTFKSSRESRISGKQQQKPEDFMDDEDFDQIISSKAVDAKQSLTTQPTYQS